MDGVLCSGKAIVHSGLCTVIVTASSTNVSNSHCLYLPSLKMNKIFLECKFRLCMYLFIGSKDGVKFHNPWPLMTVKL